jgi:hypothetical protein
MTTERESAQPRRIAIWTIILLLVILTFAAVGYYCGFEDAVAVWYPIDVPCQPLEVSETAFACIDSKGNISIHDLTEINPRKPWSKRGQEWMAKREMRKP